MSVISTVVAMPNRMAYACEALSFFKNDGCDRRQFEAILSPLNAEDEDRGERRSIVRGVLLELLKLKLIVGIENKLMLHEDISFLSENGGNWVDGLRPILFKRLTSYDQAKKFEQEMVPLGFAWLLSQGVLGDLKWSGGHVPILRMQMRSDDNPLLDEMSNRERYQNLVTWARYFGLAERINDLVIPDPTEMILKSYKSFCQGQKKWPIMEFMLRLSNYCPVVDTGDVRIKLEEKLDELYIPERGHLSQSISLALKRLEVSGVIRLEMSDDAESRTLHLCDAVENVSSIYFN